MDVEYYRVDRKDLEPEIVKELERLATHLEGLTEDFTYVAVITTNFLFSRSFNSKLGELGLFTYGAPNVAIGDRAVKRLRKKLSKAYPEMKQPEDTKKKEKR